MWQRKVWVNPAIGLKKSEVGARMLQKWKKKDGGGGRGDNSLKRLPNARGEQRVLVFPFCGGAVRIGRKGVK